MYKSIHSTIEIYVTKIGYRAPYVRHRRHILFRYLRQNVLAPLDIFVSIKMNRVCQSEDVDCFNQNMCLIMDQSYEDTGVRLALGHLSISETCVFL